MNYAKAIKELRDVLLLSQDELAKLLDVSVQTVNGWENVKHDSNKVVSTVNSFNNCTTLTELVIPSTVTEIKAGALKGCSGLT